MKGDEKKKTKMEAMWITVDSRYLDFGYFEQPLISKKNSGPCYNTEI